MIEIGATPIRIRLYSERYEVAASLFDTVFGRHVGISELSLADATPEEELLLGIMADEEGDYFVKPADPSVRFNPSTDTSAKKTGVETLEIISEGIMTVTPEGEGYNVAIDYEETELTGMEGAHSTVSYRTDDPGLVTMTRSGAVTTALTFRSHTRALCTYETPYMPFQVGIHCLTVDNRLAEEGLLRLDYIIEICGGVAERCRMEMTVKS